MIFAGDWSRINAGRGTVLSRSGVPWPAANVTGFAASAQLNSLLSSGWTWRDRRPPRRAGIVFWRRWASCNATALMALVLNTVAFTLTHDRIGALYKALFQLVRPSRRHFWELTDHGLVDHRDAAVVPSSDRASAALT